HVVRTRTLQGTKDPERETADLLGADLNGFAAPEELALDERERAHGVGRERHHDRIARDVPADQELRRVVQVSDHLELADERRELVGRVFGAEAATEGGEHLPRSARLNAQKRRRVHAWRLLDETEFAAARELALHAGEERELIASCHFGFEELTTAA